MVECSSTFGFRQFEEDKHRAEQQHTSIEPVNPKNDELVDARILTAHANGQCRQYQNTPYECIASFIDWNAAVTANAEPQLTTTTIPIAVLHGWISHHITQHDIAR